MMNFSRFLLCISLTITFITGKAQSEISLEGDWHVRLDSLNLGISQKWYQQDGGMTVRLPGTLDDAGIGTPTELTADKLEKEVVLMLTRKHRYVGPAWYSREVVIPNDWKGKDITVFLERVIWNTRVWIDGQEAGSAESLSTPQRFPAGTLLTPGRHLLVLRIDNTKQYDISYHDMAHAYTDGTQIIWNGVIGQIKLTAKDKVHIENIQVYPHAADRSVTAVTYLQNHSAKKEKAMLQLTVTDKNNKIVAVKNVKVKLRPGASQNENELELGSDASLWDEFHTGLFTVTAKLSCKKTSCTDINTTRFGLRELTNNNSLLQVNGRRIFLRGTLECDIFPLTGHPPMEKDGWLKVFTTAKAYGLNHLRFHSWCPPQAAFDVADSLGFYLQVELPLWNLNVGEDSATARFIVQEAKRISTEYGNHPSFCFWSLGNELQGDFTFLSNLLDQLKAQDGRHLYTTTTFSFQKGHGVWPEPKDDYFITQYTKKGWVRGQGIFNTYPPNFSTDYSKAIDSMPVPIITHEIGQYSVYPNLSEINKYTGVLDPLNFKAIRKDLERKQMLHLADSFTLASGKFSASLYKEEIERALKTKGLSGFQLLDLHDFPGQGTALVGILDAFWDSKGLVTPEEHRMYTSPVVPLVRFEKATYTTNENFHATVEVANFSASELKGVVPAWMVKDRNGKIIFQGQLDETSIPVGNIEIPGQIDFPLGKISRAEQLTLELRLPGTVSHNSWTFWVYPGQLSINEDAIVFTGSIDEALRYLEQGRSVLLNPDTASLYGVEGRFAPVFWSPVHFPNQPGTMGILCNPQHPALKDFPTNFYSGWQWWDLITSSKTMIIDSLPPLQPVVRVIDNFFKNRKMANVIEARVGKGKLLLTSLDLHHDLEHRPAARQLRYSLTQYMNSSQFAPSVTLTAAQLHQLVK